MTALVALIVGQSWFGKGSDPLLRPGIPDYFLVRQEWAQRDLRLSAEEVRLIEDEVARSFPRPGSARFDPSQIKYDAMSAVAKKHEKRLLQLSLWQADVFAFSSEWVQAQVNLAPATRKQIDDACRAFHLWWRLESDRLNKPSPTTSREISKTMANPIRSPDPMITLKKVIDLRRELRRMVPPSANAKLAAMRGAPPNTWQPFGFPHSGPSVPYPFLRSLLYVPRVHEELGFSMRQSRLTLEGLRNVKDPEAALAKVRGQLTAQQRKRLEQLELQTLGPRALLLHDVCNRLRVDPNRRDAAYLELTILTKKSMEIQNDEQAAYNGVAQIRSSNPASASEQSEAIRVRYAKLRQDIENQMDAVLLGMLDSAQRKAFQAMMGSPIPGVSLK